MKNGEIFESKFSEYGAGYYGDQILLEKVYAYNIDNQVKDQSASTVTGYDIDDGYYEVLKINNGYHIEVGSNNVIAPFYMASGYESLSEKNEYFRDNEGRVLAAFKNTDRGMVNYVNFDLNHSGQVYSVMSGGVVQQNFESKAFNGTVNLNVEEPPSSRIAITLHAKSDLSSSTIDINGEVISITDEWEGYRVDLPWSSEISINSNGSFIDAIAIFPSESSAQTFTHGPYGVIRMSDENSVSTFYEYDGFGRLTYLRDNEKNILKKYQYNFIED